MKLDIQTHLVTWLRICRNLSVFFPARLQV